MSLVEQYHAERKARLIRMNAAPVRIAAAPVHIGAAPKTTIYPKQSIQPFYYHQMWFFDLVTERDAAPRRPPTVDTVLRAVAGHFGVTRNDLTSSRRTKAIVLPRQVAMYLCKTLTSQSFPQIGRSLGGRDHTTILYGFGKIENRLTMDGALRSQVETIKASLR